MEEIVANVANIKFDIEIQLEKQLGAHPLPFKGMDKSGSAVCNLYRYGTCNKGQLCPFRHVKGDRTVVCKHWLRGLCKKGDECEFLHEFDMAKMPECHFYSRYKECSNKECLFQHIDPETKIKNCPWYDRGLCRNGPNCRYKHTARVLCINYFYGFCIDGPLCKFKHPSFDLPPLDPNQDSKKVIIFCHSCGEPGHKALSCPKIKQEIPYQNIKRITTVYSSQARSTPETSVTEKMNSGHRPIGEVTCYKCGEKGHYANNCPKGHLAFLSNALQPNLRQKFSK